jgi:hypothetical protein
VQGWRNSGLGCLGAKLGSERSPSRGKRRKGESRGTDLLGHRENVMLRIWRVRGDFSSFARDIIAQ